MRLERRSKLVGDLMHRDPPGLALRNVTCDTGNHGIGHGIDERLFALEVPIQRRRTDTKAARQLSKTHALNAGFIQKPEGGINDVLLLQGAAHNFPNDVSFVDSNAVRAISQTMADVVIRGFKE